jgi:hypothetical protein
LDQPADVLSLEGQVRRDGRPTEQALLRLSAAQAHGIIFYSTSETTLVVDRTNGSFERYGFGSTARGTCVAQPYRSAAASNKF